MLEGADVLALRTHERGRFFVRKSEDALYDYRFHVPLRAELKVVLRMHAVYTSTPACWCPSPMSIIC
jgi:hypothetical protein